MSRVRSVVRLLHFLARAHTCTARRDWSPGRRGADRTVARQALNGASRAGRRQAHRVALLLGNLFALHLDH